MSGTRFQMQRIPILSELFDLVGKDGRVPGGSERLRRLLDGSTAATVRPDPERPGFYDIVGDGEIYFVRVYPSGCKVLLLARGKHAE